MAVKRRILVSLQVADLFDDHLSQFRGNTCHPFYCRRSLSLPLIWLFFVSCAEASVTLKEAPAGVYLDGMDDPGMPMEDSSCVLVMGSDGSVDDTCPPRVCLRV